MPFMGVQVGTAVSPSILTFIPALWLSQSSFALGKIHYTTAYGALESDLLQYTLLLGGGGSVGPLTPHVAERQDTLSAYLLLGGKKLRQSFQIT